MLFRIIIMYKKQERFMHDAYVACLCLYLKAIDERRMRSIKK